VPPPADRCLTLQGGVLSAAPEGRMVRVAGPGGPFGPSEGFAL